MVPVDSRRIARVLRYSGTRYGRSPCRLQGCHLLWPAVPSGSTEGTGPTSHAPRPPRSFDRGFRLLPVRSPLLGESRLISFPAGTEMFHFPALALPGLCVQPGVPRGFPRGALSHSGIPGSKPVSGSPELIAAVHALHRLPSPRHPPCALRSLPAP
jgi:hypothetical protein